MKHPTNTLKWLGGSVKAIIVLGLMSAIAAALPLMAATETVNGITWTYTVNNGKAEIYNNGSAAISPSPTGAVTVPSTLGGMPVTSIGSSAFYDCSGLTSVTIPDSVTSIGSSAFYFCSGLTSVTVPNSVTSIGASAFAGCSSLISMTLPFVGSQRGNSGSSSSLFGYIFGTSSYTGGTQTRQYYSSSYSSTYYIPTSLKTVTITDETVLGYGAFYGCSELTSVTIPNSVTSIGASAFAGCSSLISMTLPFVGSQRGNSNSSDSLFGYIFGTGPYTGGTQTRQYYLSYSSSTYSTYYIPTSLKTVTITDETVLGYGAFYGCSGLTSMTIPDGVTSIGDRAFYGCSDLTSVTIPDSVTSVGSEAFSRCHESLFDTSTISGIQLVDGWVIDCTATGDINLVGIRGIAGSAFSGCSTLTSITIPDSVTGIGASAFYNCNGLTSVTIPNNVTSIGSSAFAGCSSLTNMTLPFVGSRRGNSFSPDSLFGYIFGTSSYTGGTETEQYYLSSYSSTYYIPTSLKTVTITDETVLGYGAFYNCSGLTSVTIPDSVTSIGASAFYNCSGLTSVTIPNSVKSIGTSAFAGCSGLTTVTISQAVCDNQLSSIFPSSGQSITRVILLEGTTGLEIEFFDGFDAIDSVAWPTTLREFGYDALPSKMRAGLDYDADGFMIYNNWVLDYRDREAAAVTVPNGIIGIGRGAFFEMFELEEVSLPKSLKYIAGGAFEGCTYIQEIDFPAALRYVGPMAFWDCSSLLWVSFADGFESLGERAFDGCWQMQSVRLPLSVTDVGSQAFTGCSLLRGVTVPTHVKTMRELFPEVYGRIESVEIAEGETTVVSNMFSGCSSMVDTIVPSTVTNIGAYAFQSCTSLDAIVLPNSVTTLGEYAFSGCTALWNVTLSRTLSAIPDYAFNGCSSLETMIVPASVTYLGQRFFSGRTYGQNALYYLGDAPSCHSAAYTAVSGNLTSYVVQGSRGWDGRAGSHALPQSWRNYPITYWTPNRFDVTFNANGGRFDPSGKLIWSEQQITDTGYSLPSTEPVRPGWAFNGWWTEPVGGAQVWFTTSVTATRTHTLYAHWRSLGDRMAVNFNSNGGTLVVPEVQEYVPGQTFGQFPVPTRRGYRFEGWWTQSSSGVHITEATEVPAADMELFAHWSPITYFVRFNANGGTGEMEDQVFNYDVRKALSPHAFTRTGFAFSGWATTPSGQVRYAEGASVVNLRETQDDVFNLYAVWSGAGYSVRFDSNGGTGLMDNQTIAIGETQNLWPCTFAREGYAFTGWATKPTGSVVYRDGVAVRNLSMENDMDVPLYAVWAVAGKTVRLTFDANGGSVAPSYWDCVIGTAVEAFPLPTRPGFEFVGWFTAKSGGTQVKSLAKVTSACTYYARWARWTNKVTFGKNGGTGGDNYVTVTYGQPMPTPRTAPKKAGWTFAGYWTTTGAGGVQYYDGGMKSVRKWDKKSAATLWAKWTNKVTFGKNGGTGGDDYVTCTEGQPMPTPRQRPTKKGYVFDGYWDTVKDDGRQYYDSEMKSMRNWDKKGSVTLWAKWHKAAVVKVTLGKNNGTGGDNYVTCTEGQPMPTPRTAPKRTGWTFAGYWDSLAQDANGNPTGKQYYDASMKSVRNFDKSVAVTLWAKWIVRVKLGKNGGTGGDDYVTVTYNQPFPKRTMPKRTGYAFGGYFVSVSSRTGQCYNADGTGTSSMKWSTGGTPTVWALWTKTSSCVEVAQPVAAPAFAAPAAAEPAAIPAGLYSGVLADGSGTFCLMLDEAEEGLDRTAFLYVFSEGGAFDAECTVVEVGGVLVLTTEEGAAFAFDPVAGTLIPAS